MRRFTVLASLALSLFLSSTVSAQLLQPEFEEGKDYIVLKNPVHTITPGKIEVTEAYSYTCGHCFNFESTLNAWEKRQQDDVQLVKMQVVWREPMKHFARILYTAQALGIEKDVNKVVFNAIHIQRKNLMSTEAVAEIFASLGVPEGKFTETFESIGVTNQVALAEARTRSMEIEGTPQMVVAGKYSVRVPRDTGQVGMLKIVDFLIGKVRKESGK